MEIRAILDILNEDSSKSKIKVMTLAQFLDKSGGHDITVDEEKLSGAKQRVFPKDEMERYLDRIVAQQKGKKEKFKLPYIHRSNIPIVDEEGRKYDLDKLKEKITERPRRLLKKNEKMQHSDGSYSQYYNLGLPALKGLAVDEDNNEFIIVDTCPGAGLCKTVCFAMAGSYVQWKNVSMSQAKKLNFLYNDPDGFMEQLEKEIKAKEKRNNRLGIKTCIRWHDAGDFFSPAYLEKAFDLARRMPNVEFYAYTKLASAAKTERPDNFIINFSMGASTKEEEKIDVKTTKHAVIVPKEVFNDAMFRDSNGKLQYKSETDKNSVKKRISVKYNIDLDSILTYDEMMNIAPSKEKLKYNVVVKPGDGDEAANRNDVLGSYLLEH